jgi:gliding motility-associated-like protein
VRLPSDTSLCKGGFIYLSATWPKSTYRWNTGSNDSVIMVSQSGTYSVDVTNPCGSASDAVNVLLQENICNLFIPTAFTPNRDGFNEFFEITGKDITPISLKIFNRWGQKVYENTDTEFRWDGTYGGEVCMPETYTWRFSYRLNLGAFSRINTFSGTVQLIW